MYKCMTGCCLSLREVEWLCHGKFRSPSLCQSLYYQTCHIQRAQLDIVPDSDNGNVTILFSLISCMTQIFMDAMLVWELK